MSEYLFSGLKVIDCATVIAAPAAAMILADFGADVIKIEKPGDGDILRTLATISTTPNADSNWFWQLDGRNKRSIALDLKTDAGLEILHKLVAECDVFITNQPHDQREASGLTYAALRPLNKKMIYASLTAYGEKGAERNRKGFDQIAYWARSGMMDLMRESGTRPTQGLPGMGDHPTGLALYAGIVTALLKRSKTGEGSMVQTSLLANGLWSAAGIAQGVLAGGDMPLYREFNRFESAMMRPYRTQDSRWLQFNMIRTEGLLDLLLQALDALYLLTDSRFASPELMLENREVLSNKLQAIVETKTKDEWLPIFESFNLPVNLVAVVEETLDDAQIRANNMVVTPEDEDVDTRLVINHPIAISDVPQVGPKRAPDLAEHRDMILEELGYREEDIEQLGNKGAFGLEGD
ncbi:MAG: CoA transferase [Gammaproteobacteria bacterium]|nr:CoA transferase [Gammaproteobacteria bacterium]MBT5204780.1 CoA transferase [Gammaproteobacteria bacterium]MBT5603865.1 CoA transferase [Gammaproteobacteria bacterium]MBT6244287.1 CoA transferase [Gammaproteobacteria bacterium]